MEVGYRERWLKGSGQRKEAEGMGDDGKWAKENEAWGGDKAGSVVLGGRGKDDHGKKYSELGHGNGANGRGHREIDYGNGSVGNGVLKRNQGN